MNAKLPAADAGTAVPVVFQQARVHASGELAGNIDTQMRGANLPDEETVAQQLFLGIAGESHRCLVVGTRAQDGAMDLTFLAPGIAAGGAVPEAVEVYWDAASPVHLGTLPVR